MLELSIGVQKIVWTCIGPLGISLRDVFTVFRIGVKAVAITGTASRLREAAEGRALHRNDVVNNVT